MNWTMPVNRLLIGAAVAGAVSLPSSAEARHGFDISGDYLMAGLDIGLTLDDDASPGVLLGLEFSLVELDAAGPFAGLVLAMAWASDPDVGRLTLGAEAGYGFAGLEGGFSVDSDGTFGGRLRVFGTLGVVSLYVGPAFGDRTRAEMGLLLKGPIEL